MQKKSKKEDAAEIIFTFFISFFAYGTNSCLYKMKIGIDKAKNRKIQAKSDRRAEV